LKRPTGRPVKTRESRGSQNNAPTTVGEQDALTECGYVVLVGVPDPFRVVFNWNNWVRQTHRWLSMAFTVAVIVNIVAVTQGKYTVRLGLLAVFPLAFLIGTGLYLFALPYATKWRNARRTD
jgi:hypothetical protein